MIAPGGNADPFNLPVIAAAGGEANGTTTWTWSLPTCCPPGHVLRVTVDGGTFSQDADRRLNGILR